MNKIYETSINEIKGLPESQAEFGSSLEKNIIQAQKKLLKDLTNEDLRMLLGQNLHLELIVPLVLERLKNDLFIRSEDMNILLLSKLLQIDLDYWKGNPEVKNIFLTFIESNIQNIESPIKFDEMDLSRYNEEELPELKKLIADFKNL